MKCEICEKENDGKITIVIILPEGRIDLKVCGECLNDYANQKFDRLTEKLKNYDEQNPQDAKNKPEGQGIS